MERQIEIGVDFILRIDDEDHVAKYVVYNDEGMVGCVIGTMTSDVDITIDLHIYDINNIQYDTVEVRSMTIRKNQGEIVECTMISINKDSLSFVGIDNPSVVLKIEEKKSEVVLKDVIE